MGEIEKFGRESNASREKGEEETGKEGEIEKYIEI